jgi:SET domain-containing protein
MILAGYLIHYTMIMKAVAVYSSAIHGLGVFSTQSFQSGEVVLVLDDSRIVDTAHPLREELGEYDYHCDYLADGLTVLMPFPERHINHSCVPNTCVKTRVGKRHVIALRDIRVGEEITYDYLLNCHGGVVWQCSCGAPGCRGTIPASFFDLPISDQLRLLPLLDEWFTQEHAERIEQLLLNQAAF